MQTTLNAIRKHHPCASGWHTLLKGLNKTATDDEPLLLSCILEINGLDDALWAFRAVEGYAREMRLFAVWCARQVAHLNDDPRVTQALDVATRYANGEASDDELRAARSAAYDACTRARARARARTRAATVAYNAATAAYTAAYAAVAYTTAARATAADAAYAAAYATVAYAAVAYAADAYAADAYAAYTAAYAAARDAQTVELQRVLSEIEAGRDPYPNTNEGA